MSGGPLYHPVTIGSLKLPGNLFLAPVAGYTDRAYRSICAEMGADFAFTELVSAEALTRNPAHYELAAHTAAPGAASAGQAAASPKTAGGKTAGGKTAAKAANAAPGAVLVKRGPAEKHYAVQLFGAKPEVLAKACAVLAPFKPDAIDLNAGCPVPKVTKTGAGSALMKTPSLLGAIVEAMVRACEEHLGGVPVTVKIRSGWDNSSKNYRECARTAVDSGAAMVSLHPRTRAQGYGGTSDWSLIADLAALLTVPVTGSGDLYSPEDARRMLAETGCAAVMFARGAMGNPFIFPAAKSLLAEGIPAAPPTAADRLKAALRHLEALAVDLGEKRACLEMRKQFCAYTKGVMGFPGISGGAALRQSIVRAETLADYRKILYYYIE